MNQQETILLHLRVAEEFRLDTTPVRAEAISTGLINTTSVIYTESGAKYILQKINTVIFRHPDEVMENIVAVTEHLKEKIRARGGDEMRETMTVIRTKAGDALYLDASGGAWRMYTFIPDTVCYNEAESPSLFRKVGHAFGCFQRALEDFDASVLHEAIPKFHDTVSRYGDFLRALEGDAAGRRKDCEEEIAFFTDRKEKASLIVDGIRSGKFPLRVTHNDTKLNNILIDKDSGEGICVIDLDTVMPGSMLYDYGDALRTGASSAPEDEVDLSKVYLRMDMFEAFTKGFLEGLDGAATAEEIRAFPLGFYVITYEQGIRFLGDYLNGDVYFKTTREHHNLDRARTQIALIRDIERHMAELDAFVASCL